MEKSNRRVIRKKRGSNLFVRYFTVSAVTVAVSFIIIGLMMTFFVAAQWWTDKVDVLTANADNIVDVCGEIRTMEDLDEGIITGTLQIMSASTQSEYFITDKQGNVILFSLSYINVAPFSPMVYLISITIVYIPIFKES